MDLNDIWQEHKVWILGVVAGVVVFLIANGMISSTWDTSGFERTIAGAHSRLKRQPFYGAAQRRDAGKDKKALDGELGHVVAKAYFALRPEFDLAGKGGPTLHYLETTTVVKKRVKQAMDSASVDFTQQQLGLPANSPVNRQEIQKTLVGLDLIDDVLDRLLAANDVARAQNRDAQGLRALDQIQIDTGGKDSRRRARRFGRHRKKEIDLGDRVGVKLRFHSDWITFDVFLESLVAEGRRPLLLEELSAKTSDKPGEPMAITCRFVALLRKKESRP